MYNRKSSLKILTSTFILYVTGISIAISPFVIRNYRVSGEFALTTSQSGFNLYQENRLENWGPVAFATTSPFEQGIQFTIEASKRVGKKLSPGEASSYWTREAIKIAIEHPAAFIWKLCQKTLFFFQRFQLTDHYHIGFISRFVTFFKIPFFTFNFILPLGMAAMLVSMFDSGKSLALNVIFMSYALALIVFATLTRYRLPLLIILIPFAVTGISRVLSCIKKKELLKIGSYALLLIAFVIIEFIPTQRTGDMTAYYNTHAFILNSKGFEDQAMLYSKMASQMNGCYSDFANLSLAKKYHGRGDIKQAKYYLDKIHDNSFTAAQKYDFIGDVMMRYGQIEKAISAYKRSLEINSGQRRTRLKLIKLYFSIDEKRALQEHQRYRYISSFYDNF